MIEKFLHPFEWDILPGVQVAYQTFYIVAITHRGFGLCGKTACCFMSASVAPFFEHLVFGYMDFYWVISNTCLFPTNSCETAETSAPQQLQ